MFQEGMKKNVEDFKETKFIKKSSMVKKKFQTILEH